MKFLNCAALVIALLSATYSYSMVGGRILNSNEKGEFRSIFGLRLRGFIPGTGEAIAKGMASHIGNGYLLTAHHVPNSMKPISIQVVDIGGKTIGSTTTQFVTFKPDTEDEIVVSNTKVNLPDIAVLEMPKSIRDQIASYPVMAIDSHFDFKKNTYLFAIGWGSETFESSYTEEKDKFKIGPIQISEEIDLLGYKSIWLPKSKYAAVRPGDSGGPLVIRNAQRRYTQIGVSSLAGVRKDSQNQLINAEGYFSPLNRPSVYNWLKKTMQAP